MRIAQLRAMGIVLGLSILGTSQVLAQRSTRSYVSRPSDAGPSVNVGQTGGTNTKSYGTARSQSQVRFDFQNAGVGALSRGFGMGGGGGTSRLYSGPPINSFRRTARGGPGFYGAYTSPLADLRVTAVLSRGGA